MDPYRGIEVNLSDASPADFLIRVCIGRYTTPSIGRLSKVIASKLVGATTPLRIVTYTIFGVPYYNYSIMGPQNPILIIKAPISLNPSE